jgi:hypothetical protein
MKKTMQMRLLKSPNPRIHFMLFQANSPFRARTVENKKQFQRHEKHRNQSFGE